MFIIEWSGSAHVPSKAQGKAPNCDCFSIIIETSVSSPCSKPTTVKRTSAERKTEMQIGFWVTVKCPQAESQRKISEIQRDLKRFQFLLCFWQDPCQTLRPGVRATICIQGWKEKKLEVFHYSRSRNLNYDRRESNPSAEVSIILFCVWLAASPNTGAQRIS